MPTLVRCAEHLETAKFVEFWEVANLGGNELLDAVAGFDEAIRRGRNANKREK